MSSHARILALLLILVAGCEGSSYFAKVQYTTEPLYPIQNATGKYTVVFLQYFRVRGHDLPAVAYANHEAKKFRDAGADVYVAKGQKSAFLCLGSFNEPDGVEAKRNLAQAQRLVPGVDVISSDSKRVPAGQRVHRVTKGLKPHTVSIENLIELETGKPDIRVIYEKPQFEVPE